MQPLGSACSSLSRSVSHHSPANNRAAALHIDYCVHHAHGMKPCRCCSDPGSRQRRRLQIRLFDTATLNCTAILTGHSDAVLAMDARPLQPAGGIAGNPGSPADTTLLVSAAKDRTIRLWSAPSGHCLGEAPFQ